MITGFSYIFTHIKYDMSTIPIKLEFHRHSCSFHLNINTIIIVKVIKIDLDVTCLLIIKKNNYNNILMPSFGNQWLLFYRIVLVITTKMKYLVLKIILI